MIAHQNEFDSAQAMRILRDPNIKEKDGFLPLIRRETSGPDHDPDALVLLSQFEPREAYPLVIADLQSAHPVFRTGKFSFHPFPDC